MRVAIYLGILVVVFAVNRSSATTEAPTAEPSTTSDAISPDLICVEKGAVNVRDETLTKVVFSAGQGEEVTPTDPVATKTSARQTFVEAYFPRHKSTSWVLQTYVHPVAKCSFFNIVKPKALPAGFDPMAPNCAKSLILKAAKKNVANTYGDRAYSTGSCAFGVDTSLVLSKVGGIKVGLYNAIDYVHNLPPYGFVDIGLRDPNMAPPGSVIVLAGPDSAEYLAEGGNKLECGTVPAGSACGHVTIKGDDGYYYTDGRTEEPDSTSDWEDGVDVTGDRRVAGIYVPGPKLVQQFANECGR